MRVSILASLFVAVAAAASPPRLSKRCSPVRDPDYQNGYLPPAPCWQSFDPACQPHIRKETDVVVNPKFKSVVVFGVDEFCFQEIAEEQARAIDGRKTYGWDKTHGQLTRVVNTNTLVISHMTDEAIKRYQDLVNED